MNRRSFMTAAGAAALAPAVFAGRAGAQAINYDAIGRIRTAGLSPTTSEVMKTASYMMDVLGPRLSGSPGIRRSGEWVVSKMKEWGLTGSALEPWPTDPTGTNNGFPRGWSNSKFYLHAVAPNAFPITGMSIAWTPGTNGLVRGECVVVTETDEKTLREKYAGKLQGQVGARPGAGRHARAMGPGGAALHRRAARPDGDACARRRSSARRQPMLRARRAVAQGGPGQPQPFNRNNFFRDEGALGVFATNKGQGVVNILGGSRTDAPDQQIPRISIIAEHYGRIARSVSQGQNVTIEADIRNDWRPNPEMFNVVGEIRGTERPEEVVILGGHFDSFHSATGATDNGGACATILEAMRLLKTGRAPLKRTVRVCLWNGEEQGLIGSRLYVAQHFGGVRGVPTRANARGEVVPVKREHGRCQVYFNLDNGAGSIRGVHGQGNQAIAPIFRQWMEPFRDLGMTHVSSRSTGSTDHASFDAAGLPGFQFIQDPIDYEPKTHHTNMDFYESLQPEDMRRNAVMIAGFAMLASNHNGMLPRKQRPAQPAQPTPPAQQPSAVTGAPSSPAVP